MNATAAQVIAEREELTPDLAQPPAGWAPRSRQPASADERRRVLAALTFLNSQSPAADTG
jgi:hypothetical protein